MAWCGCVGIYRVDISISARTLWCQFKDAVPLSEVTREILRLGEKVDLLLISKA